MAKTYMGDNGLLLDLEFDEDISAATNIAFKVLKPSGAVVDWTPSIYGTAHLRYVATASDINEAGYYKLQPVLTLYGWTGRGETATFAVYPLFA